METTLQDVSRLHSEVYSCWTQFSQFVTETAARIWKVDENVAPCWFLWAKVSVLPGWHCRLPSFSSRLAAYSVVQCAQPSAFFSMPTVWFTHGWSNMSEETKQDMLWLGAPQAAGKQFLSLHCTGKQQWLTLERNFSQRRGKVIVFKRKVGCSSVWGEIEFRFKRS